MGYLVLVNMRESKSDCQAHMSRSRSSSSQPSCKTSSVLQNGKYLVIKLMFNQKLPKDQIVITCNYILSKTNRCRTPGQLAEFVFYFLDNDVSPPTTDISESCVTNKDKKGTCFPKRGRPAGLGRPAALQLWLHAHERAFP